MRNFDVEFMCIRDGVKKQVCMTPFEANSEEAVIGKVYHALQVITQMHPECRTVAEFPAKNGYLRIEVVQDYHLLEGTHGKPEFEADAENPFD